MASQSRAQRRQKNARQAQAARATTPTPRPLQDVLVDQAEQEVAETAVTAPTIDLTPRPSARQSSRQVRRPIIRPLPEPVDYSQDYVVARSDLIKIAIWSTLLFGGMFVIKLTGLI